MDLSRLTYPSETYGYLNLYDQPVPGASMTISLYKTSTGAAYIMLNDWRFATAWPVGTFQHYVVAYDANGREGTQGEIVFATNLGEIQWLRPTEGQTLETRPTFQWSNVWPPEVQAVDFTYPNGYGYVEIEDRRNRKYGDDNNCQRQIPGEQKKQV